MNGVGLEYNHLFGFGVLDAAEMVMLSMVWKTAPPRFHCEAGTIDTPQWVKIPKKIQIFVSIRSFFEIQKYFLNSKIFFCSFGAINQNNQVGTNSIPKLANGPLRCRHDVVVWGAAMSLPSSPTARVWFPFRPKDFEQTGINTQNFHTKKIKNSNFSEIPADGNLILELNTDACIGTPTEINYLEHVQAVVTLNSTRRGDTTMYLVSPVGTR